MHFAICMAGPFCRPALHCWSSNRERQKTLSGTPKPVGGKAGTFPSAPNRRAQVGQRVGGGGGGAQRRTLHAKFFPQSPTMSAFCRVSDFFLKFAQEEAPPASRSYSCCCLGDDAPTSEMGWFGPRAQGTSERQGRRLG